MLRRCGLALPPVELVLGVPRNFFAAGGTSEGSVAMGKATEASDHLTMGFAGRETVTRDTVKAGVGRGDKLVTEGNVAILCVEIFRMLEG